MVAPGRNFVVSPFFGPKTREDQKKGLRSKISGFSVQLGLETKQIKKQGLHHKSVELWFDIIVWLHFEWCHPKMVSPGATLPL